MNWDFSRVLVTGAGGFIATHLIEQLSINGAKVRAFAHYNSRSDPGMLRYISNPKNIEIIYGDLLNYQSIRSAMEGIDIVYHLGAMISVPYSYQNPEAVIKTNVLGTLNVMMAAQDAKVKRIIHTSTSEVYGTAQTEAIKENHPLVAQSPYAASKIAADKVVESFEKAYNSPVTTLRLFNTYGPLQSARAVIPTIISQALQHNLIYLGNLTTQRDFTYVSDMVIGFMKVVENSGLEGKTIHLGSGKSIMICDLAKYIGKLMNKTIEAIPPIEIVVDKQRLRAIRSEVHFLKADNRKAKELMDWQPWIDLETGLNLTIQWIRDHLDLYQPGVYRI